MATLLLTAVGTAIGGPIGGALGALVGQQADRALFGGGSGKGPRLKELAVTTSSYGHPLGRHFGRVRVAGSVIWATDLVETSSSQGGKGRPKTTTYSYSANFAVALSSTPIERLGRIWADGNLLRGAVGDLKTSGQLRVYLGNGDDAVDPLIAADKGPHAPAFRDCAYVVFEGLELADFGNRIPALTFEIFTPSDPNVSLKQLVPASLEEQADTVLRDIRGFTDEGGALSGTLSVLQSVFPLDCLTTPDGLRLSASSTSIDEVTTLPEALVSEDNEGARERLRSRVEPSRSEPVALRYYDEDRDYQPGVQRAIGRRPNGRERMVDLPATLTADGAKALVNTNANRARWGQERLTWLIAEIDPRFEPGRLVRVPGSPGVWRVTAWEWFDRGVELSLERFVTSSASNMGGDTGTTVPPMDALTSPTLLDAFELPAIETTDHTQSNIFAAASSHSRNWAGAALYVERGDTLAAIGSTGRERAIMGSLVAPLSASSSLIFQPTASLDVALIASNMIFADTDLAGIANGANRLLVGGEIVQFLEAERLDEQTWRLRGLLRGRAGTEDEALSIHPSQTPVVLLDNGLVALSDPSLQPSPALRIAAIGRGDDEAVFAPLRHSGLSRRPLTPVHPRLCVQSDNSWQLSWTRRARGHWRWDYAQDVPLVEESESYLVGFGDTDDPFVVFATSAPTITMTQAERESLLQEHGAADLWVSQVGTYSRSKALLLTHIA